MKYYLCEKHMTANENSWCSQCEKHCGVPMFTIEEYDRNDPTKRIEDHFERILRHLDPHPERGGLDDTPARVTNMWLNELTSGYHVNPEDIFRTFDSDGYDGIIAVQKIPVKSVCEHHLVPFIGHAWIGYLPNGKVVGLSKLARLVDTFSRRLQIQERLTMQIADTITEHLKPRGVIVVVEAEHFCMTIRGVQAPGTTTLTSAVRGVFNENKEGEKEEFLSLIGRD